MEWNLNVPKVLHTYWGGRKLLYIRYLTIISFMKHNPDWKIFFWHPEKAFTGVSWEIQPGYEKLNDDLCDDYLPELMKLPISKIPVDFESLGFAANTAEVHKADYIRVNALSLYGGAWADMDIIFFKSMENLEVNIPENRNVETYVCISHYGHSTGFHLAIEGSKFFEKMVEVLKYEYKRDSYQCLGPDMFNKYFPTIESINKISPAINLKMEVVYNSDCWFILQLLDGSAPRFTDGSIGCHWYAAHSMWGKFLNETHGGIINLPDNVLGNILKTFQ